MPLAANGVHPHSHSVMRPANGISQTPCRHGIVSSLTALAKDAKWDLALSSLVELWACGVQTNVVASTAVIKACARQAKWHQALNLLQELAQRTVELDVVGWNTAISACKGAGQWDKALLLLSEAIDNFLEVDAISYSSVISACSGTARWALAIALLEDMERRQIAADAITFNTVTGACAKAGRWDHAIGLLSQMQTLRLAPTTVSFNTVINSFQNAGSWQYALRTLGQMQQHGLQADVVSYNAVLSACGRAAEWQAALQLLWTMRETSVATDFITHSEVLTACESAGQWSVAMDLAASLLSDGGRGHEPHRKVEKYRHDSQAGSPTDIVKHVVLTTLLRQLVSEAQDGCVYMETHSGVGAYDVPTALQGIWRLQESERRTSDDEGGLSLNAATYLQIQQDASEAVANDLRQPSEGLQYYVGSPILALSLLRLYDKAILLEDDNAAYEKLRANVRRLHSDRMKYGGVEVIHADCYEWVSWPFLHRMSVGGDRQGVVFIDPPYDSKGSADTWNLLMIQRIRHHWPGSSVVLWHPANNADKTCILRRRIQQLNLGDVLAVEASVDANFRWQLTTANWANVRANSGMLVISPPQGLRTELKKTLASVRRLLEHSKDASDGRNEGAGTAAFSVFYLSEQPQE